MNEAYTLLDAAAAAARWGWLASVFLVLGAGSYAPFLFNSRTHLEATDPDIADVLPRRAAGIGFSAGLRCGSTCKGAPCRSLANL